MPWIRIGLTSAAFITLIAIYAPDHGDRDDGAPYSLLGEPPQLLTPPSPWRDLSEGDLAIIVQDERLAGLSLAHSVRAHDDGTLQDIIEIGRFRSNAAYLRILLERKPGDAPDRSFFVDLALNAAQAGLAVARTQQEEALGTRNGRVEVARVRLENGPHRNCLAYRAVEPARGMTEAANMKQFGWLCAAGLTRADLACAIDGLQLRHRETGLRLSGPVASENRQISECPRGRDPGFADLDIMPVPAETTASLAGPQSRPTPPPRPSER